MKNQLSQRRNIRLSPEAYKGRIIHIIICTLEKTPLFANKDIAYSVKQQILDLSRLKQVRIYAYVVLDRKPCFFGQKFETRSTKYETMTKIKML